MDSLYFHPFGELVVQNSPTSLDSHSFPMTPFAGLDLNGFLPVATPNASTRCAPGSAPFYFHVSENKLFLGVVVHTSSLDTLE